MPPSTAHMEGESPSPLCPHVPAELWAAICSYTDDFTLWIHCRRVSKMLRFEAEREFAQNRLAKMELSCKFLWNQDSDDDDDDDAEKCHGECNQGRVRYGCACMCHRVRYDPEISCTTCPEQVVRISEDRIRVSATIHCEESYAEEMEWTRNYVSECIDGWDCFAVQRVSLKVLKGLDAEYVELKRLACYTGYTGAGKTIRIGHYANDVGIPDLQLHRDTRSISFNWKTLLNNFFSEEARYQKMAQEAYESGRSPCNLAADGWCRFAEQEFVVPYPASDLARALERWSDEHGRFDLWQDLYLWRILRAHTKAGKEIDTAIFFVETPRCWDRTVTYLQERTEENFAARTEEGVKEYLRARH